MKNVFRSSTLLIALALLGTFFMSACDKKDDPKPVTTPTITGVVTSDPNFSILAAAVTRAGLADALNQPGTLTVFAPDNKAFTDAGITADVIATIPVADLAGILKYHVLGSKVMAAGVPASDAVVTLQGQKLFASKNANGVFVNGIGVKTADVAASNGVIHVISGVLYPPTASIAEIASGNPEFSILLSAVVKAGLAGAAAGPGKFTVFAPTNAAFEAAGLNQAAIDAASVETVTGIVQQHIIATNVYASDLINGATAPTLKNGATLTINTSPAGVKLTGSANPFSNVVTTTAGTTYNITATNGVVHVIDKVIL
ncbi:fasciclin domain-containing protein [Flavihumibacter profundi]|uniref:fasciclin domain-containing protein n=1 Tax=Flavihumibacter profundi TaxID=2716883 RepID=UPI001CC61C8E|nr:fasciclin domain-containing protein [Flavihumibacter profundi]MBZ5858763.1 fasciclin domain-containing protein [Flavihumibacter profundi]